MPTPAPAPPLVLEGRPVLLVGGGPVALHRGRALTQAGARLHVVFIETLIVVGGASMLWHSWR